MPTITRHKIYEAYRKLKNYFYYDNTSLTIRYKIAEYEQQFYTEPNLDFEQRFKVAMESVYKIVNGEDRGNRLLNTLLSQINFTNITKSVEKPGDEKIVVCLHWLRVGVISMKNCFATIISLIVFYHLMISTRQRKR